MRRLRKRDIIKKLKARKHDKKKFPPRHNRRHNYQFFFIYKWRVLLLMSLCLWLMNFNLFTIASRCGTARRGGDVIWVQIIYRVLRPLCAGYVESDHERKQVFDWNFVKTWEYSYARLALTISWFWSLKLYATLWDIHRVFSIGEFFWSIMIWILWLPLKFVSWWQILSQFSYFWWTMKGRCTSLIFSHFYDIWYQSLAFFAIFMKDLTNQLKRQWSLSNFKFALKVRKGMKRHNRKKLF